MSLFEDRPFGKHSAQDCKMESKQENSVSARLLESFAVSEIPFLGCDFDKLYPVLNEIIPNERVEFYYADINTVIACETICAAICHQMNWDFLRQVVLEKTEEQINWITPEALSAVSEDIICGLLAGYNKPERIRAGERASILRSVGDLAKKHGSFKNLFLDNSLSLLPEAQIRGNLLECCAFAQDPEEKKLQLLLQKLSNYTQLAGLASYCKPAVDYHLIRCFLRRGLIYPTTKLGKEFVFSPEIQRQESTMGALRQLCATLVKDISNYTGLSINSINQIEWQIGRSICKEGAPDCDLKGEDANWVLSNYDKCPFYNTCCAINYNQRLLSIEEPTYTGSSY